ncbi:hypothetical protein CsSME_00050099 [Camellia sinensis var. sinensis]
MASPLRVFFSDSNTVASMIEKLLKLLEILSTYAEERAAIGEDESCVAAIVISFQLLQVHRPLHFPHRPHIHRTTIVFVPSCPISFAPFLS